MRPNRSARCWVGSIIAWVPFRCAGFGLADEAIDAMENYLLDCLRLLPGLYPVASCATSGRLCKDASSAPSEVSSVVSGSADRSAAPILLASLTSHCQACRSPLPCGVIDCSQIMSMGDVTFLVQN